MFVDRSDSACICYYCTVIIRMSFHANNESAYLSLIVFFFFFLEISGSSGLLQKCHYILLPYNWVSPRCHVWNCRPDPQTNCLLHPSACYWLLSTDTRVDCRKWRRVVVLPPACTKTGSCSQRVAKGDKSVETFLSIPVHRSHSRPWHACYTHPLGVQIRTKGTHCAP